MKKEYDFSKGERGKFYQENAKHNLPIYLEPNTQSFVERLAKKKKSNISKVVNELIESDMKIAEYLE